ncbi:MAG: hypothetical protein ACI9FD_001707 [Gammaproteobacteria bacterium]
MQLQTITIYPLKSAQGQLTESSLVEKRGLQHDRRLGLFQEDGKVITARDFPVMLDIVSEISPDGLTFSAPGREPLVVNSSSWTTELSELNIWDDHAIGQQAGSDCHAWFSELLGSDCKLMGLGGDANRKLPAEVGGQPGDQVSFADECPLLLTSTASLEDLNSKLDESVPMSRFRPNVVISGCDPFAEDGWKNIQIGEVLFEVTQSCKRCVFTTIDQHTKQRHPSQEPLRTLSTYRRHPNGGAAFGVHLVGRSAGRINIGDTVTLVKK